MKFTDLTHTFASDMPVYPGDTKPEIKQDADIKVEGYNWFKINTGLHVGTHIDAPLHFLEDGKKISDFSPDKFLGQGVLIDARGRDKIDVDLLEGVNIQSEDIILFYTGFAKFYQDQKYFTEYPALTESAARKLIELGVKIVGTDTPSPDYEPFAVHKLLLAQEILIIENLTNLESLLNVSKFEVVALPAKLETEAAPVRVIAKL